MPSRPLNRRLLLQGLGVTLAIPFLEAMLPIKRSWAAPGRRARFAALYIGNGMLTGPGGGDFWSCGGNAAGITTLSTPMQELAAFKDYTTVVQNCSFGLIQASGDAGHEQAAPSFLTGQNIATDANVPPPSANSLNVTRLAGAGMSLDRRLAASATTPLKQLMMAVGPANGGYVNTDPHIQMMANLSWDSQTRSFVDETIRNPQDAFNRLLSSGLAKAGSGGDAGAPGAGAPDAAAAQALARRKSVLDAVLKDLNALNARLGPADRLVMDQYASAIRQVETDIQGLASGTISAACTMPSAAARAAYGANSPVSYGNMTKSAELMIDLMALAFQCGITDVSTLMLSYDWSKIPSGQFNAAYGVPNITAAAQYHNTSHYSEGPGYAEKLAAVKGINTWHAKRLAYLAKVFKNTLDSDGRTLLDNSVVLFGAGMGDPQAHSYRHMLRVLLGKGQTLKPGAQGKIVDAGGTDDAHPRLLQSIANSFGLSGNMGMSGGGTINGIF